MRPSASVSNFFRLLIADRWEVADALNQRIHSHLLGDDAPTVAGARRHRIGVGDIIITRRNDRRLPSGSGWVRNGDGLGDVPYPVKMEPNLIVEYYAKN